MKNKKRRYIILALIFVSICVMSYFVFSSFAKYMSAKKDIEIEPPEEVTPWDYEEDEADDAVEVILTKSGDKPTVVYGNAQEGDFGVFKFKVKNTGESEIRFTVSIKDIAKVPSNMKFYTDKDMNNEINLKTKDIAGIIDAQDDSEFIVKIYWKLTSEKAEKFEEAIPFEIKAE